MIKLRKRRALIPVCLLILVLTIGLTRPWLTIKDSLISKVRAQGSSPWTQTDWSGGSGQTNWSDATKYFSSANINNSTPGQLTLAQTAPATTSPEPPENPSETVILNPEADSYVRGGSYANTNYGTDPTLITKLSDPGYTRESFIRFDLSSVTTEVKYASLKLYVEAINVAGVTNKATLVPDNSWAETTITFNNKPASTTELGSWIAVEAATVEIEATTQVLASLTADKKLSLRIYSLSWDVWMSYGSRESSHPPELILMDQKPLPDPLGNELLGNAGLENFTGTANDGVKDDFSAWNDYGYSEATTDAFSGNYAAHLVSTDNTDATLNQDLTITPGKIYKISFYTKGDGTRSGRFRITGMPAGGVFISESSLNSTTTYQQKTYYFIVPTGATTIRVWLSTQWNQIGAEAYFDDLSLREVISGQEITSGSLISSIFDKGESGTWQTLTYNTTIPASTAVAVKVRTSNNPDVSGATNFNSCSAISSGASISSSNCVTDTDRYAQYQLTLSTLDTATPTFKDISLSFTPHSIPAFPGAEGHGAKAIGGRGGRVIEVTNLNDSGPGSLRAAIEASGPRTVVFRVAGIIRLSGSIRISQPYITIAGQTAPGGGITLVGGAFIVQTHNVIIRYLRWRGGANSFFSARAWNDLHDFIVDHCSASWGEDDTFDIWFGPETPTTPDMRSITVQNCLNAEALAVHPTGMMVGATWTESVDYIERLHHISVHHNLFVHNDHRNPRFKAQYAEAINNIVYNWGNRLGGTERASVVDWIGNYFKAGPMTSSTILKHLSTDYSNWSIVYPSASLYVVGNVAPEQGYPDPDVDNWGMYIEYGGPNAGKVIPETHRRYIPLSPAHFPVTIQPVNEAYNSVLADVGANARLDFLGKWVTNQDSTDKRLISDVQNGTGPSRYTQIASAGDIGPIDPGTPYPDTDHDGMSDEWENNHFGDLSRGSPTDSSSDYDSDGYTDLEEFLNGTNPKDGTPTTPTATPTPTPTPYQHCLPLGDIDCSGKVNSIDFSYLIAYYNTPDPKADLDKSGQVNALDVSQLLTNFGKRSTI